MLLWKGAVARSLYEVQLLPARRQGGHVSGMSDDPEETDDPLEGMLDPDHVRCPPLYPRPTNLSQRAGGAC